MTAKGGRRPIREFHLLLTTAAGVTLLAFATEIGVSLTVDRPTDQVKTLLATCDTVTKMGAGAFIGFVGGRRE